MFNLTAEYHTEYRHVILNTSFMFIMREESTNYNI